MTEVYVNLNQVCYVEDNELCVEIFLTNGHKISVVESIDDVLDVTKKYVFGSSGLRRFNRFHPTQTLEDDMIQTFGLADDEITE